jgi:hypothetical protein
VELVDVEGPKGRIDGDGMIDGVSSVRGEMICSVGGLVVICEGKLMSPSMTIPAQ